MNNIDRFCIVALFFVSTTHLQNVIETEAEKNRQFMCHMTKLEYMPDIGFLECAKFRKQDVEEIREKIESGELSLEKSFEEIEARIKANQTEN